MWCKGVCKKTTTNNFCVLPINMWISVVIGTKFPTVRKVILVVAADLESLKTLPVI